jgi:hydrogenase nickel incorporation protein HypB
MCGTCGCKTGAKPRLAGPNRAGKQGEAHAHPHSHPHAPRSRTVRLEAALLAKNDQLAAQNREWLTARGIVALNLIGAPGAGKTALLEQTIRRIAPAHAVAVIEGDQETDRDAERIRATGSPVVQINTGAGCHLDASMLAAALPTLLPSPGSLLFVENVGNLVCPALFDLGERAKVVVMSTTEGEDKPLKYPHVFRAASVFVLNKTDLLPHLEFDAARCLGNARRINPQLRVFSLSATAGEGLEAWCEWLRAEAERTRAVAGDIGG